MFSNKAFLLSFAFAGSLAAPAGSPSFHSGELSNPIERRSTANSQGTNNGYFYSTWSDGTGDVEYNNGPSGQYSLTWSNAGDVVVGKGFETGAARNITYTADYEPQGISFLSVYGWFTDPLTEYYICENYGSGSPAGGDGMIHQGQLTSDGSVYDVYEHQQVNAPSIQGVTNFKQYWSIRQDKRTSGTINTANHYNYWKSIGLPIGTFGYQILATEGVQSSGKSSVTVSEGDNGSDGASDNGAPSSSAVSVASASESSAPPATSVIAPIPTSEAPAPVPSSEAPAPVPSSPAPAPASASEAPVPRPKHKHRPAPAPFAAAAPSSAVAASVAPNQPATTDPATPTILDSNSPEIAYTTVFVTQVVTTVETVVARV